MMEENMRRFALFTFMVVLALFVANSALASSSFMVSTDRVSYTGTVTVYDTIEDARAAVNARSGPTSIPNRITDSPYDTPNRDAGMLFSNSFQGQDDSNILLTSWYYTTVDNTNGFPKDNPLGDKYYSGYGNPNNTNTGFIQLYDEDGSTDLTSSGSFSDFDGTYYTTFNLQVSGENAPYSEDWSRLWHAPQVGGASVLTAGQFIEYNLNITFGGLQGVQTGDLIEAYTHPDSVVGTLTGIFENTDFTGYIGSSGQPATDDPSLSGFYVFDFTFNMDNWAFGQGDEALNGDLEISYFAEAVPVPAGVWLLGSGVVFLLGIRRKHL